MSILKEETTSSDVGGPASSNSTFLNQFYSSFFQPQKNEAIDDWYAVKY